MSDSNDPTAADGGWFDDNAPQAATTPPPGSRPGPNGGYYDADNHYHYADGTGFAPTPTGREDYETTTPGRDPSQWRDAIRAAYQQYLGRDPTDSELASDTYNYSRYGQAGLDASMQARARGGSPTDQARGAFPAPNLPAADGAPQSLQPWTGHFEAPTAESVTSDQGFQFRLGEGIKALQRSAASKGTLLTGGTLKDLTNYGQNYASNEYGKAYDRAYNNYETDRTDFLTNEANRYSSERGNRMDNWGISSDYFNIGRANRNDDFNIWNTVDTNDYMRRYNIAALGAGRNPYA